MYWTWTKKSDGQTYISWGKPRSINPDEFTDLYERFDIQIYQGETISAGDKVAYCMQGDSTLGFGDSIWLISYLRDVYRIKARRRCNMHIFSSPDINRFCSNFLPISFNYREEYLLKHEFDTFDHVLPAMYYWHEFDGADRSWLDNKSILERLYDLVGIEYQGLPDFGEFTKEHILYPNEDFYKRLGIHPNDKYIFLQWHSSGISKNLPPKTNIRIIKHLIRRYGLKVYIIGRMHGVDQIEEIHGVVNLINKTMAEDLITLAFNSEFIVAPDSAGIHLGEAYRIPAVGIMGTLPPVYIANKYKIPTFMYGSGDCPYKPCGITTRLPMDKCPIKTNNYCNIFYDIDLDLLDKCIEKTHKNRDKYRKSEAINFYDSQNRPIN